VTQHGITFVGMDAHKKAINVAMLLPGKSEPVEWEVANEPAAVRRLAKKLEREASGGEVRCCYEAGPCGYTLQRQLEAAAGVVCEVIAPSLIPVKPGERIKTNRRDALKLARQLRADELTAVHPPTPADEAVRDLCRCREDARKDLLRAQDRLEGFLLRRGYIYSQTRRRWGQPYRGWLNSLTFEHAADQVTFADYRAAVDQVEQRLQSLNQQLATVAEQEPYRTPVGWLRCFRGIDTLTAMIVVAELHDFRRFLTARALMAYLGLVPSEHSTGEREHRGMITRAGNAHVRRLLIEAAWHYRHRPHVGPIMRQRRAGQPSPIIALADRAQNRLCQRYRALVQRGKPTHKAVVAVARELVGFVWAALHPAIARNES
jgi:transposase